MNQADALAAALRERFRSASVQLDTPGPAEVGFVDLFTVRGHQFAIECDTAGGFGLSSLPYGESSDERFDQMAPLLARIAELDRLS